MDKANEDRFKALQALSDDQLYQRFWQLTDQIVQPLITYASQHTSPSIERSVLLRMGFNSLQAQAFVDRCLQEGCLGHGAGAVIVNFARRQGIDYHAAFEQLMAEPNWKQSGVLG